MPSSSSKSRAIPTKLQAGGRAVLKGLQARPELNGRLVKTVEPVEQDGTEATRWKTYLLGNPSGSKDDFMAIKEENLQPAPPSALLYRVAARGGQKELVIPLACSIGTDGYGGKGVRLMYSEFLGREALIPAYQRFFGGDDETPNSEELDAILDEMFGIVTSPYDGHLAKNECVVVRSKYEDLLNALIAYECLMETGKTVVVGMHRDPRVCKILFPYDIE